MTRAFGDRFIPEHVIQAVRWVLRKCARHFVLDAAGDRTYVATSSGWCQTRRGALLIVAVQKCRRQLIICYNLAKEAY
jgi:hypothetical protein